ncbi:MAG TPA: neutral zinc metallopeptidase, partial [Rhizomicrobium sp.]|nr:neutral zinc metallopeptidase [Rhizomicrobium sp.]
AFPRWGAKQVQIGLPMRLDDLRPSDNVDDRRGEDYDGGGFGGFGGPRMVFGGGGLGLVAVLLISLFFGVDPSQLLGGGGPVPERSQRQDVRPCAQDTDCDFARRVIGSAEDVWQPLLRQQGVSFRPAVFTPYDYATPTGCGTGQSSAGPFYCPSDEHIYLDLSFFQELSRRFGAPGNFARAYVIAHEYGHHIQNLTGVMERGGMGSMGPRGPQEGADSQSVRTELQADCYAGVWAYHANQQFSILQSGDVEGAIKAASAVGDDTLQKESQGYIVPDSFTHGTSAQRVRWFERGLKDGRMDACDTFAAARL